MAEKIEQAPPVTTKESPLGIDAPEKEEPVIPQEGDELQEEKKETPEVTDTPTFSAEELAALQKDADMYRLIKTDPNLMNKVLDHVRGLSGEGVIPKPNPESKVSPEKPDSGLAQELAQLKEQYKVLAAQNMISSFFAENPDAKNYRKEMGELIGKHPTFTLQEAYDNVRSRAKVSTPSNPGMKQPEGSGNIPRIAGSREEVQRRINDPKETPDFDAAVNLAMSEAIRSVGQE